MNSKKPSRSKRPVWRRPWMLAIFVLLLGGGAGGWFIWGKDLFAQSNNTSQAVATARTATVTKGNLRISVSGSGTLQAGETVDLSFSTRGSVVELNVKVGDAVTAGQVLAKLGEATDLEANLASAKLSLLQAQNSLSDLRENADKNLAQAYQDLLSTQTAYNSAVTAEHRTTGARCSKEVVASTKQLYENSVLKLEDLTAKENGSDLWITARNDYDTALANYVYCKSYTEAEKTSAGATTAVALSALKSAETTYSTLKAGSGVDPVALTLAEMKVAEAEAKLAQAEDDLAGITLTAPMDGKIVYLASGEGTIMDTARFITIASMSTMSIQVSVDETDMDKLALGNSAEVVFDALPEETFNGKVTQVDPQLSTSGQYRVTKGIVTLDEAAVKTLQALPLGLSATVTILSQQADDILIVPVAALKDLGDDQYAVMLKASDGTLKLQIVQVGIQTDTSAEILSGLRLGDEVSTGTIQTVTGRTTSDNSAMPNDGGMMAPPDGAAPPMP